MSLPAELRNWVCCPACGGSENVWRQGRVGVPPSRYGKRTRTKDSNKFRCRDCGEKFTSGGGTRRENMGYNVSKRDETAFQGDPP